MKICHINLSRTYRGGERQTELLIGNLSRLGVQQRVIVRKGSLLESRFTSDNSVEVKSVGGILFPHLLICRGVDLIHAHTGRAAHLAQWNCLAARIPYLITRRVPNIPGDDWLTKRVYRKARCVVALSQAIRTVMLQYDSSLDVRIIPSTVSQLPVCLETVAALKKTFAGKFIVGHIGALQKRHKGQQFIIEAARELSRSHPAIHFLLIGEGEDEAELKKQAAGLDNLSFLGFKDNVGDYLSLFDLFVFPSLKEGLGSILLDAMEFGKPIVATSVDGIQEIVSHGDNGLLVPVSDVGALRKAILTLYNDAEMRIHFGENSRNFVQAFSPKVGAESYLALYNEILGQDGGPAKEGQQDA